MGEETIYLGAGVNFKVRGSITYKRHPMHRMRSPKERRKIYVVRMR